jgi:hypothetical protein
MPAEPAYGACPADRLICREKNPVLGNIIKFAPAFASDGAVFDYGAVRELRAIIVKRDQP